MVGVKQKDSKQNSGQRIDSLFRKFVEAEQRATCQVAGAARARWEMVAAYKEMVETNQDHLDELIASDPTYAKSRNSQAWLVTRLVRAGLSISQCNDFVIGVCNGTIKKHQYAKDGVVPPRRRGDGKVVRGKHVPPPPPPPEPREDAPPEERAAAWELRCRIALEWVEELRRDRSDLKKQLRKVAKELSDGDQARKKSDDRLEALLKRIEEKNRP